MRSKGAGGGGLSINLSRRTLLVALAVLVLAGLGIGLGIGLSGGGGGSTTLKKAIPAPAAGKMGFEGIPLETGPALAPTGSPAPGGSIDGIQCSGSEQLVYHIHVRLTIFVNGHERAVPAGVGFSKPQVQQTAHGPVVGGGACVSWLHTHTTDGIVHIESPLVRTYTLGNFFDIWRQPLSQTQVGPAKGKVTVLVNGKVWTGNPRSVPLNAHTQIQLEVGKPLVQPVTISNWAGL
ncbi:MAG: hypothetical protein ACRDLM_04315 [Gaiellaceae bacterium]